MNLSGAIDPGLEALRRTTAELQTVNVKSLGLILEKVAPVISHGAGTEAANLIMQRMQGENSFFRTIVQEEVAKAHGQQVNNSSLTMPFLPFHEDGIWIKAQTPVDGWNSGDKPEVTGMVVQHCSSLSADTHEFVRTRQENEALKLDLADEQATSTRLRKERKVAEFENDEYIDGMKQSFEQQLTELTAQLADKQRQLDRFTDVMIVKAEFDAKKTVVFVDEPPAKRIKGLDNIDTDDSSKEPTPSEKPVRLTIKEKKDLKAAAAKELANTMAKAGRHEDELDSPPKAAPKAVAKKAPKTRR